MNKALQPYATLGRSLIWLGAIVLLLAFYGFYSGFGDDDRSLMRVTGTDQVILSRDRQGHFRAKGEINGQPVDFLVDTGATDVAVSARLARKLGLETGPEIRVRTASGTARGHLTRLEQVAVGPLLLDDVRATIMPELGGEALLGMSFLRHLDLIQSGDQLILAPAGQTVGVE